MARMVWPQKVYDAYLDNGPQGRTCKAWIAKPFIRVVSNEEFEALTEAKREGKREGKRPK
jgi:hypothetical protein